jgi:hypothetical protein
VLFFHRDKSWRNLKQFMLIAIDPTISLHQFFKTVEVKLVLEGYLSDSNRVFYMNLTHKQLSINSNPLSKQTLLSPLCTRSMFRPRVGLKFRSRHHYHFLLSSIIFCR